MKRLIFCAVLLFFARCAFAQSTTVSGTISDLSGQSWNNGTYSFVFRVAPTNPTAQYFWNGAPFSKTQTFQGALDGSGHFSVSLPSNTSITPSGSSWDLTVCPISKGNSQCFTVQSITITGTTQDLTSVVIPPAISIDLAHPAYPFVVAYKHQELTTAPIGGIYYDFTLFHYYICETIVPTGLDQGYGTCSNWVQICQAGDTSCGGGGGGGGVTILHNGVVVGTEPKVNLIDGSNVTLTVTDNVGATRIDTTIAASGGGGSGCTLPGHDQGVLSEHPAGTCYDSVNFTWDDSLSNQLLQAGLSNIVNPSGSLLFTFGNNNSSCAQGTASCTQIFTQGHNNTIEGAAGAASNDAFDVYTLGLNNTSYNVGQLWMLGKGNDVHGDTNVTDNMLNIHVLGDANTITAAGAGGAALELEVFGFANTLAGTTGGIYGNSHILGHSNHITASGTGSVQDSIVGGINNTLSSNLGNAFTSSIYSWSEDSQFISGSSSQTHDIYGMGIQGFYQSDGASSVLDFIGYLGFGNQATSTNGHSLAQGIQLGTQNIFNSSTADMLDVIALGKSNTFTDCTDCIAIGKSISMTSADTNSIKIGMPSGKVGITSWPVTKLIAFTACPAGCTLTVTPCTASGGSYHDCPNTLNFSGLGTFADTQYVAACNGIAPVDSGNPGQPGRVYLQVLSKATGSIVMNTVTTGSGDATWGEFDCTLTHR